MALERPQFKLVKKIDGVELREYDSYQVASCDVSDIQDLNRAANFGFRFLFNYISGQNKASQKIAMTVPVQQTPSADGWKISFVVPRDVSATGAPKPSVDRVQVETVAGGLVAALRYRGFWSSSTYESKKAELLGRLDALGYQPIGEVFSAVYNPPLTPPPLRHNEVLVRVKPRAKNGK